MLKTANPSMHRGPFRKPDLMLIPNLSFDDGCDRIANARGSHINWRLEPQGYVQITRKGGRSASYVGNTTVTPLPIA